MTKIEKKMQRDYTYGHINGPPESPWHASLPPSGYPAQINVEMLSLLFICFGLQGVIGTATSWSASAPINYTKR